MKIKDAFPAYVTLIVFLTIMWQADSFTPKEGLIGVGITFTLHAVATVIYNLGKMKGGKKE